MINSNFSLFKIENNQFIEVPSDKEYQQYQNLRPTIKYIALHGFATIGAFFYTVRTLSNSLGSFGGKFVENITKFGKFYTSALLTLALAVTLYFHKINYSSTLSFEVFRQLCWDNLKDNQYTMIKMGSSTYVFHKNSLAHFDGQIPNISDEEFVTFEYILNKKPLI